MNHTWKIYDLKRVIANGMVTEATYACESEYSGSGTRLIGEISFTTGSASDADFISYNDLTEATVLGWVTSSVDTSSFETPNSSSIAQEINARTAKTKGSGTPW